MKKILALLLALVMALSLTACVTGGPSTGETQNTLNLTDFTDDFKYPMDTDVTITMFRSTTSLVKKTHDSFTDTPVAKALAANTGINVEFVDEYSDYDSAWSQMLTEASYTDMISFNPVTYTGGPSAALADGLAIPLNDIINQYMPNFRAYLAANPSVDKAIKTDDGIYYMIPYVNSNTGAYSFGAYYREDLLKQLNATEPTTIDEWHTLLTRVKNELGITPITAEWLNLLQYGPFAMAFGVGGNSTSNHFAVDDNGDVYYQRNTPEYKAFIETMYQWYKEGLIDVDLASIAAKDVNSKVSNGIAFMSMGWLSAMQSNQIAGASKIDGFQLKAVGTPTLEKGDTIEWSYATSLVSGVGTTISNKCSEEKIEACARYLDYLFSEEGHIVSNFGVEGESYSMVDGQPTFLDKLVRTEQIPQGFSQNQMIAPYSGATTGAMAMYKHEGYYPQLMDQACAREAIYTWMDAAVGGGHKHELPTLSYTEDETDEVGMIVTNLKTLTEEMALKFVVGTRPLTEWDAFMTEIDNMKVADALEIMNAAMDRYSNR